MHNETTRRQFRVGTRVDPPEKVTDDVVADPTLAARDHLQDQTNYDGHNEKQFFFETLVLYIVLIMVFRYIYIHMDVMCGFFGLTEHIPSSNPVRRPTSSGRLTTTWNNKYFGSHTDHHYYSDRPYNCSTSRSWCRTPQFRYRYVYPYSRHKSPYTTNSAP